MIDSIRARLFLVLGLAILIESTAVAVAVYRFSLHEADELFDAQLARSARILAQMVEPFLEEQAAAPREVTPTFPNAVGHPYERKLIYQVWNDDRQLLLHSANAPEHTLAPRLEGYMDIRLDDSEWRLFSLHDPGRRLWFVTGESAEIRGELSAEIAVTALVPLALGVIGLALAVGMAGTYGLAGIRRLSNAVSRRHPDHLDPIVEQRAPSELRPLVSALNRLMQRVERAMIFERRFIADAAHELRTPLAALRIHLENALGDEDPQSHRESLVQSGRALERLIRLVDQLLTLSRLDPDAPVLERDGFDVGTLAREAIADLEPLAKANGVTISLDERTPTRLIGIPVAFQSLIRNLVDNAVRYSPQGGHVQVVVAPGELRVEDQGPGIPAEIRDRIFERFVRGSRETSRGSGLGLSIVHRVAVLHDARITLEPATSGQMVRVSWTPVSTPADQGPQPA